MMMKAVMMTGSPMNGVGETSGAVSAPATPARAAPMNIASRAVLLIDMPCSAAASRSWAQARSAQPNLLLRKNNHSADSRMMAARMT
jgi:hypothetical protein